MSSWDAGLVGGIMAFIILLIILLLQLINDKKTQSSPNYIYKKLTVAEQTAVEQGELKVVNKPKDIASLLFALGLTVIWYILTTYMNDKSQQCDLVLGLTTDIWFVIALIPITVLGYVINLYRSRKAYLTAIKKGFVKNTQRKSLYYDFYSKANSQSISLHYRKAAISWAVYSLMPLAILTLSLYLQLKPLIRQQPSIADHSFLNIKIYQIVSQRLQQQCLNQKLINNQ